MSTPTIAPTPTISGRCGQIGDDDQGNPRIVIFTTREQLGSFPRNLLYSPVSVSIEIGSKSRGVEPEPENPIQEIAEDVEIYWLRIHEGRITAALLERAFPTRELKDELADMKTSPGSLHRVMAKRGTVCMEMQLAASPVKSKTPA